MPDRDLTNVQFPMRNFLLAIRHPLLDGCALSGLHSRPLIFG